MGNKDNNKKKASARKYKKNRLLNLKNILPNINNELSGEQCHDDNAEVLLPSLPESSDVVYENLRPVTTCFFGIQSKIQDADKTIEAASLEVPDATDSTITTIQDEPTTPPPPPTPADEDMPFFVESECETRTKEITGRRIVDTIYFLKQLQEQKHDPLFKCDISCLDLQTEKRCGLVSHFSFVCKMCKKIFKVCSDDMNNNTGVNVNTAAVSGIVASGIGYSQLLPILPIQWLFVIQPVA